jgi:hypothetical protein
MVIGIASRDSWTVTFVRSNGNVGCHWLLWKTSDEKDRAREDGEKKKKKKDKFQPVGPFFIRKRMAVLCRSAEDNHLFLICSCFQYQRLLFVCDCLLGLKKQINVFEYVHFRYHLVYEQHDVLPAGTNSRIIVLLYNI